MTNAAPIAVADAYSVHQGQVLQIAAANGVLANDTDADNDPLTAVLVANGNHGGATLFNDGSFSYSANAGYVGTDVISYKPNDGTVDGNTVNATITITNTAPVADNLGTFYVHPNQTLNLSSANGLLSNAADADGDTLTASIVSNFAHGSSMLMSGGAVTYIPDTDYIGVDSLTFTVNDGAADSNAATLYVSVWSNTPSELYATYTAAVGGANADYVDAVGARDAAIASARVSAESDAHGLYATYLEAVANAQATCDAAIADADATHQMALADADATWHSATATARATFDAANANAEDTYASAINTLSTAYANAIATADTAYGTTVSLYQSARDSAYAAWQAEPENTDLEAAYTTAETALEAATASAASQRSTDYAEANEAHDEALNSAEFALANARQSASEDYEIAIGPSNDAWNDILGAALAIHTAARRDARNAFLSAEAPAWTNYVDALMDTQANLAVAETGIQGQYAIALANWESVEAAAWHEYETGMSGFPSAPELGARVEPAPSTAPFEGLTFGERLGSVFALPVAVSAGLEIQGSAPTQIALEGFSTQQGTLTYLITALPSRGQLYDGADDSGHLITGSDLANGAYTVTDPMHLVCFVPNTHVYGVDEFSFAISHANLGVSEPASVHLDVIRVDDAPKIDRGIDLALTAGESLADIDPASFIHYTGTGSLIIGVQQPDLGSLTLDPVTNRYVFTADPTQRGNVDVYLDVTDGVATTRGKLTFLVLQPNPWQTDTVRQRLDISRSTDAAFVRRAIRSLDAEFRLTRIPNVIPNDPAPRSVSVFPDEVIQYHNVFRGGVRDPISTPAQLARINLRVNIVFLKQQLVNGIYNMVVNNPPAGRQWNENDRGQIAAMANQTADDLILMVDLFLRTHPGARPELGSRNLIADFFGIQDRVTDPWCSDWAEAMDAWISVAIRAPGRNHPANNYIRFQWGQCNNNGQHDFIVISPLWHNVRYSQRGNAEVDPVILLFDPWRDLLPRLYRAEPLTQGQNTAPTEQFNRNRLEEQWYWDHRNDPRFREPQLGLPTS